MEETRGWGGWVGFEGERVGVACGMKRMRQIMITKKKKEKHLHFNLKAEGGRIFFLCLCLLSFALALFIISAFGILKSVFFCILFHTILM